MAESIKIEGLEAVRLALLETPKHLRAKVMHSILRKAAGPIVRAAKAAAPVAKKATKRVIPGLLKRTLSVTRSKLKKASLGEFGVFITARIPGAVKRIRRLASKLGAKGPNFGDPFYHRFQEGGFTAVGRRKPGGKRRDAGKVGRKIAGKKYLGNAYESNKQQAVKIIQADLVKATVAAFEKRARK